jgi:aromatic ring-opening dioxygenase catalytic subunit (LigB family)
VLGVASRDEPVTFPVEGFDGGSVSMLGVRFG